MAPDEATASDGDGQGECCRPGIKFCPFPEDGPELDADRQPTPRAIGSGRRN
jgi:hypothetical protein